MTQKIRVGLVGFGISGQVFHAPVMRSIPELELVKITARKAEQKVIVSEKYPTALAVDHIDDIIICRKSFGCVEIKFLFFDNRT